MLSACSEDEGEWKAATQVKGMASMRVTAKRAKNEYYAYVRSNRSGRRSVHDSRHHWPIFVFTGASR